MNGFFLTLSSFSFSVSYRQTVGTTGSTPLHFAAANGCLNVVDILLRHGAIVDMTDKVCISLPSIVSYWSLLSDSALKGIRVYLM